MNSIKKEHIIAFAALVLGLTFLWWLTGNEGDAPKSAADKGGHIAFSIYTVESDITVEGIIVFAPSIFPGASNNVSHVWNRQGEVGAEEWGLYFSDTGIDRVTKGANGVRLVALVDTRFPDDVARPSARRELCQALPVVVVRLLDKYVSAAHGPQTPTDRLIYVPCPAPI